MTSVGMGLGWAAGAAPAGAATTAAAGNNPLMGVVQRVESLVCPIVDIATGTSLPTGRKATSAPTDAVAGLG